MGMIKRMYVDAIIDMYYLGYTPEHISKALNIPLADVLAITNIIKKEA